MYTIANINYIADIFTIAPLFKIGAPNRDYSLQMCSANCFVCVAMPATKSYIYIHEYPR